MHIIKADKSHFHTVFDLVSACREQLNAGGIDQWDDRYPDPTCISHDIESGHLFIAQVVGRSVGAVTLDQEQESEYSQIKWRHAPPCLVLHRLCVSPENQGSGIGSALMRFAERRAIDARLGCIRLDVYSGNLRAINLYRHLGYSIAGQFKFPSRDLPFHCMEKRIQSAGC